MAKDKAKGSKGVPNKHLHARVAFLQQAATYLALQRCASDAMSSSPETSLRSRDPQNNDLRTGPLPEDVDIASKPHETPRAKVPFHSSGLPHYLSSHLRQVALKAQIRLDPSVKRVFCKTCNAVLIEGETCLKFTENLSRGGRKSHAEMLVLDCQACGTKKRFPMAVARQRKKNERKKASLEPRSTVTE